MGSKVIVKFVNPKIEPDVDKKMLTDNDLLDYHGVVQKRNDGLGDDRVERLAVPGRRC